MAVSMADITKLRKMTGAGMMDCKNALTEADGDFDGAMKIIREKGQAVAAKRSDREASEGCVLVKVADGFGAIIALKCETDFVAQNADFIKLTQDILDAAVANKCKTLEEVKALPMGDATKSVEVILDACCAAMIEGLEERKAEKIDMEAAGEAPANKGKKKSVKARLDKSDEEAINAAKAAAFIKEDEEA